MTDAELIQKAYEIIGNKTPLKSDCGRLCNAICCKGDDETGMLLFPGEEELCLCDEFKIIQTDYSLPLLICDGTCNRDRRPLACRIFPLAIVNKNGIMRVITDPRCRSICPLYRISLNNRLDPAFTRAVKDAGKVLFQSENIRQFTAEIYKQCLEFEGI